MQLSFYTSLDEVRTEARKCQGCSRAEQRYQVVMGAGDPNARLMLIAEYPSQSDDRTGIPYSGPAGDYLDVLLEHAGINRSVIYITNIVRCYSTGTGRTGDRISSATQAQQRACSVWTDLEVQFVRPDVILALGGPSAKALIDSDFELTAQRGQWYTRTDGIDVLATYQPAYVLRLGRHDPQAAKDAEDLIIKDIRAAYARSRTSPPG